MSAFKAGGYDFVVEINEKLLNKIIAAYYYMGKFPDLKGTYLLPVKNLPADLVPFVTLGYIIRLNPPSLNFISSNKIIIYFSTESVLTILGGIEVKLEIEFRLTTKLYYDTNKKQLLIDFTNPDITVEINDKRISKEVDKKLDEILSLIFREYINKKAGVINVAPFVKNSIAIKDVDTEYSIDFKNFIITDNILALALNTMNHNSGNVRNITDFIGTNDLGIALSENAINRSLDYWWNKGIIKNTFQGNQTIANLMIEELLKIKNLDLWRDILGGFLSSFLFRLEGISVTCKFDGTLQKPSVNIMSQNKLLIRGKIGSRFTIRVYLNYKQRQIVKLKLKWKHRRIQLMSWTDDVSISYMGKAKLLLDMNGNLSTDITWLRVLLNFGDFPKVLDVVVSIIANFISELILKKHPPVQLGSIPVSYAIPDTKLTIGISPNLKTTNREILITTPVRINGLENYPPPPFTANRNPQCKEVHKTNCVWVNKISKNHKVPYYWLDDAHNNGYDNCFYCLGNSKR